jgi:pyridinium-3,5-bisthiocarboxylic acid mononucleotide nickel chelatase
MTDAYFDCFSGISGDMTIGALLDMGVPLEWLRDQLATVAPDGYTLSERSISHHGIQARQFMVGLQGEPSHRNYGDIKSMIENSPLSSRVKQTGLSVFDHLAEAEAKIHGVSKETVHFHEVGALDSIVDIIGSALCLEYLKIDRVMSSKIPLGSGFVTCQHGTLPLPAPATLEILSDVPVYGCGISEEMVTPTGAALIKALAEDYIDLPTMTVKKIGYGAGSRHLEEQPNLLRVIMGNIQETGLHADDILMVETCIDDMNPEIFGYLMERLFLDGALDVYWIPIFMKKNRPGTLIQVLCKPDTKAIIIHRILSETTSTGVRYQNIQRMCLARESVMVSTEFGEVPMKQISNPDGTTHLTPEYEVCKKIAHEHDIPLKNIYRRIMRTAATSQLKPKPILDKT